MSSSPSSSEKTGLVATAIASTLAALAVAGVVYQELQVRAKRQERSKKILAEIEAQHEAREDKVLPSIISHFHDFELDYGATIEEANKKRTTKYYEMARDAHLFDLVPAIKSYPRLRNQREDEMKRIFQFRGQNKSHRTVIVMCDEVTSSLLCQARTDILKPLNYSHDITTSKVWIPAASVLPQEHLHVTIAIPWWWHGIRPGNLRLSEELAARFRQALVLEFHHAFQLELERIVLLGGKTLVALWRCVGEREAPGGLTIFDRHGEGQDPVVKLRRDIVRCFTSETIFGVPLTYAHKRRMSAKQDLTPVKDVAKAIVREEEGVGEEAEEEKGEEEPPESSRPKLERRNTIEWKTPGLGDHDGFIHTTLARLPIDCLSMTDVELEPIHRLCRETTAFYCGHRMVVSKFRFVETTGEGGESNPCIRPIFDESVEAPARVGVGITGEVQRTMDLHAAKIVDRSATIGNLPTHRPQMSMDGLFDDPTLFVDDLDEETKKGGVMQQIEASLGMNGNAILN